MFSTPKAEILDFLGERPEDSIGNRCCDRGVDVRAA